jgi:hypothetical protein
MKNKYSILPILMWVNLLIRLGISLQINFRKNSTAPLREIEHRSWSRYL